MQYDSGNTEVAVDKIQGTLHNSEAWQDKLLRGAISFEGLVKNPIEDLTLVDGELILEPQTLITINGHLKIIAPARMRISHEKEYLADLVKVEGEGTITFDGFLQSDQLDVRNYFLSDTVRLELSNCHHATIAFNRSGSDTQKDIYNHQIYVTQNSSHLKIYGNHTGRLSVTASNCNIYDNQVELLTVGGGMKT